MSKGITSTGSEAIFTPAGKRTRTGSVKEFVGPAVAQLARVTQPPRVDAAVGQQGVLAGVRRGHLRDRPGRRTDTGEVIMSSGASVLVPPKNVPQCWTVLDLAAYAGRDWPAAWTAGDCATAGMAWRASRRAIALRPAAARPTIRRMLLCVLDVRFTGSPPRVPGTAPRRRQLTTPAAVSAPNPPCSPGAYPQQTQSMPRRQHRTRAATPAPFVALPSADTPSGR